MGFVNSTVGVQFYFLNDGGLAGKIKRQKEQGEWKPIEVRKHLERSSNFFPHYFIELVNLN